MIRSNKGIFVICLLHSSGWKWKTRNEHKIHPNGLFWLLIWIEKRTAPKIWMNHLDGSHRWSSWMEMTDGETNMPWKWKSKKPQQRLVPSQNLKERKYSNKSFLFPFSHSLCKGFFFCESSSWNIQKGPS